MADKYVGAIVMEVNGKEVEVVSLEHKQTTGRKVVQTMNSKGRALGASRGVTAHELTVEVAIPLEGDLAWADISDARITQYPFGGDGGRVSYLGCGVTEVSSSYKLEGAAVRRLSMFALDRIEE